jgi:NitT/TauT family transport system permease protein
MAVRLELIDAVLVSSPSRIASTGVGLLSDGRFLDDLGYSATVFIGAVALAVAVGAPTGLVMGYSPTAHRLIHPFVVAFNALPKVALMPLIVLWVGLGRPAGVLLATLMASFPVLIATATGLRTMERDHVTMARAFGASPSMMMRRVILPGVVPHLLGGLRVGVSYALVGVIIAEFFASSQGLGYRMVVYMQNFEVDAFFVCLITVAVVAIGATTSLRAAEQRVQAWRPDAFEPVRGL